MEKPTCLSLGDSLHILMACVKLLERIYAQLKIAPSSTMADLSGT